MVARAVFLVAAVFGAVACKKNVERAETGKVAAPARQAEQGEPRERSQPVNNDHLRGIIKLDSDHGSTCALDDQGRVFCWGRIEHASNEKGVSRPWRIGGLPEARDMRVRGVFEAIGRDDKLYRWGYGVAPYYEPLPPRPECVEHPEARGCSEQVRYEVDPEFDPGLAQKKYPDEVFAHDAPEWLEARTPQIRDTRRALFTRLTVVGDFLEGGAGVYDRARRQVRFYGWEVTVVPVEREPLALIYKAENDDEWTRCFVYQSGEIECPLPPETKGRPAVQPQHYRLPSSVRSVGSGGDSGGVIALDDGRVVWWDGEVEVHPLVGGIVKVDGGGKLACGIDGSGKVQCWQHPRAVDRPLSAEERAVVQPRSIPGIDDAVEITSDFHSCVILSDTRVKCWGLNESGECGVGHYAEEVEEPAYVLGPDNMEAGS